MTLLAPAAYSSIAVMYCQIIVTFLSVTRVEIDLWSAVLSGIAAFDGFRACVMLLHFILQTSKYL